jgi:uncharacterized protein YlxP (DUF503 family)
VSVARFDLRIPNVSSLKEKRHVVKSLTSSLRAKFNVSVAEVDHLDLWQRSGIAVSAVAGDGYHLKRVMHEVEKHVERFGPVDVIDRTVDLLDPEDE